MVIDRCAGKSSGIEVEWVWVCAGKAQGSTATGRLAAQGLWGGITLKMGDFSLHNSWGGLPPRSFKRRYWGVINKAEK